MRSKEQAQDYRYFPDPDILPIEVDLADVLRIKGEMPMLPVERREMYQTKFGLPAYDAGILTSSKYISDYFEKCVACYDAPKKISNWILTDLLKLVKEEEVFEFPIAEQPLAEIIKMVDEKKINKTVGLQLLDQVAQTGKDPMTLAKELGLLTTISEEQITSLLQAFKDSNPKAVEDYKKEPQRVIGFIVGYVMKNTAGKANGELVKSLIAKLFG